MLSNSLLQDGEELTQEKVADFVNIVYEGGYNSKEQSDFDDARQAFKNVIEDLLPFDASEHEDEFYELIRSLQVVPQDFAATYEEELKNKRPFEAMKFLATVTLGQGMKLKNQNALMSRTVKMGKREISYLVAACDYDDKRGLLLDSVSLGGVIMD